MGGFSRFWWMMGGGMDWGGFVDLQPHSGFRGGQAKKII